MSKARRFHLSVGWFAAAVYWLAMGSLVISAIVHPSDPHHHRFARNLCMVAVLGFVVLASLWKGVAVLMNVQLAEEIAEPDPGSAGPAPR